MTNAQSTRKFLSGCAGCGRNYGHAAGCTAKSEAAKKAAETRKQRAAQCRKCYGVGYQREYNTVGHCYVRISCAECKGTGKRQDAGLNPLKVGAILHGSWGYDQTNCEFYQVTESRPHSVTIRRLAAQSVGNPGASSMSDTLVPLANTFTGEPLRRNVSAWGAVKAHDHCYLSAWDGSPKYSSWYA